MQQPMHSPRVSSRVALISRGSVSPCYDFAGENVWQEILNVMQLGCRSVSGSPRSGWKRFQYDHHLRHVTLRHACAEVSIS